MPPDGAEKAVGGNTEISLLLLTKTSFGKHFFLEIVQNSVIMMSAKIFHSWGEMLVLSKLILSLPCINIAEKVMVLLVNLCQRMH